MLLVFASRLKWHLNILYCLNSDKSVGDEVGRLSNELLRKKTMKEFLLVMGFDLAGVEVSSLEGLYGFSFKTTAIAASFASQLRALITTEVKNESFRVISLSNIIAELERPNTSDNTIDFHGAETKSKSLLDLLQTNGSQLIFAQESSLIEIDLPGITNASLLNLTQYPVTGCTADGRFTIDIKKYLEDVPESIIKVEGCNETQTPLIFLKSSTLESQHLFYATKKLTGGAIEVTPYFFVPQGLTPPSYHLILDVSISMRKALTELKNSIKTLAQQLFEFQPTASLTITTFSDGVHFLGEYSKADLLALESDVMGIKVISDTPLYDVTSIFLDKILYSSVSNNVLLFADGDECGSLCASEEKVRRSIADLGTDKTNKTIRNKFYILSYLITQGELMQKVAETFFSEVINLDSADFMEAQVNAQLIKQWAVARELFKVQMNIDDELGSRTELSYSLPLERSGQIVPLKSRVCKAGDKLSIHILDGEYCSMVRGEKKINAYLSDIACAELINTLGVRSKNTGIKLESTNCLKLN